MLFEVVLALEGLSADFAGKRDVVLVAAFVNHKIVRFGEPALTVLADEVDRTFRPHFLPTAKLPAVALRLHRHNREHFGDYFEFLLE